MLSTSKSAAAITIFSGTVIIFPGTKLQVSKDFTLPKLLAPSPVFPDPLDAPYLPHLCPFNALATPALPLAIGFGLVFVFPPVTFASSQYTKSFVGVNKA
jgi:hypothetical protein